MKLAFEAIGTHWDITCDSKNTQSTVQELRTKIHKEISNFDRVYSRFRSDSLVSQISKQAGNYAFPPNSIALFDLYEKLYRHTDGAITPLIGDLMEDVGYDPAYSLNAKQTLRVVKKWDEVMDFTEGTLQTKQPIMLDFGAAGKGYLVDIVAELLNKHGCTSIIVNAGGDIRHIAAVSSGNNRLRVGLEHPDDESKVVGVAEIYNKSICGSAGNRRKWGPYHHIMDPYKQQAVQTIKATWVVADTALVADGLATALCFSDAADLKEISNFEYMTIYADNSFEKSDNFPANIFV